MKHRRKFSEESPAKVPAYIVTFSDMTTLLLTFFVLLLSLAKTRDPNLYQKGRDSFLQSMRKFGVGMLLGGMERPHFGYVKIKHFISKPDAGYEDRSIDAKEEELRRIFRSLGRSMKTMPSQIAAKRTHFTVTNIRFAAGDATLSEGAKTFLRRFCQDLQHEEDSKTTGLYVLGTAGEEATEEQQWIISAKRAQVVADFIKMALTGGAAKRPVYCWGAGPGGEWVGQNSPISRQTHILIAVLRGE